MAWWAIDRARKRLSKVKGANASFNDKVAEREESSSETISRLHGLQGEPHGQELPGVPLEHEMDGVPRAELEGSERWAQ